MMQLLIASGAAIVLFLYGLQGFSRELQEVGGDTLRRWISGVTDSRLGGFCVGAAATAIVQSSSAVTSLATALVDSGVISFRGSLGILLGANVGTTATAWLVSFKLTGIGPWFLLVGALVSALPVRVSVAGKAVFYFGLIFFSLDLISAALGPLREFEIVHELLALATTPWLGALIGIVITAIIQSSSVTTGLAILLVQRGTLPPEAAIALVIGANVGSTSTALMASLGLGAAARATAIANLLFNVSGLLLLLPFLGSFSRALAAAINDPGKAVAAAHLLFNVGIGALFLAALGVIEPGLRRWLIPREVPSLPLGRGSN